MCLPKRIWIPNKVYFIGESRLAANALALVDICAVKPNLRFLDAPLLTSGAQWQFGILQRASGLL
jgi:hypothetical protein